MAAARKKSARSAPIGNDRLVDWWNEVELVSKKSKKKAPREPAFPENWNDVAIPQAITTEWIQSAQEPYLGLEAYLLSLICTAKWAKTIETVLDALPPGYRLIWRLCDFYSDVKNGGFVQFLGNKSRNEAVEIVETMEMLRRFGLPKITSMLRKAIALMGAELPSAALSMLSKSERERAAKKRLSDEELERRIHPIDMQFFRIRCTEHPQGLIGLVMAKSGVRRDSRNNYISKADRYIKRHPEEFVHEKLSTQKPPSRKVRR